MKPYQPIIYDPDGDAVNAVYFKESHTDVVDGSFPSLEVINNTNIRYARVGKGIHGRVHLYIKILPSNKPGVPPRKIPVAIKSLYRHGRTQGAKQFPRSTPIPRSTDDAPPVDKILGSEARIRREIAIMKKMRHANIVRLYEVIDEISQTKIYMIMEYMGGGEVKWNDGGEPPRPILSIRQTRRIMRDVLLGLEYLHHQGIIHRDIKPANLLWTDDRRQVKIGDFGVSHVSLALRLASLGEERSAKGLPEDIAILWRENDIVQVIGTPSFIAPEVAYLYSAEAIGPSQSTSSEALQASSPSSTPSPASPASPASPSSPSPASPASPSSPPQSQSQSHTPSSSSSPPITKAIDVWALGVTLYCFLFGTTPFKLPVGAVREYDLYRVIRQDDWDAPEWMGAEPERIPSGGRRPRTVGKDEEEAEGAVIVGILDRLLKKNPLERMTLQQLKNHPWLLKDIKNPDEWLRVTSQSIGERITVSPVETLHALPRIPRAARSAWWGLRLARTVGNLINRAQGRALPTPQPVDPEDEYDRVASKSAPGRMIRRSFATRESGSGVGASGSASGRAEGGVPWQKSSAKPREILPSKPISIPQSSRQDKGKGKAPAEPPSARSPRFPKRAKSKGSKSLRSTSAEKWLPRTGNSTSASALQGLSKAPSASGMTTTTTTSTGAQQPGPVLSSVPAGPSSPMSTLTAKRRRWQDWLTNRTQSRQDLASSFAGDGKGGVAQPVLSKPRVGSGAGHGHGLTSANTRRSEEALRGYKHGGAHIVPHYGASANDGGDSESVLTAARRAASWGQEGDEPGEGMAGYAGPPTAVFPRPVLYLDDVDFDRIGYPTYDADTDDGMDDMNFNTGDNWRSHGVSNVHHHGGRGDFDIDLDHDTATETPMPHAFPTFPAAPAPVQGSSSAVGGQRQYRDSIQSEPDSRRASTISSYAEGSSVENDFEEEEEPDDQDDDNRLTFSPRKRQQ